MITDIKDGDITDHRDNPGDIIIGMNTEVKEASAIGQPFARKMIPLGLLNLGTVLTFRFDEERLLHMIICHHLSPGGWRNAEQYVRFGLDFLWQSAGDRKYGIVQIGKGPVGKRDGADFGNLHRAISDSYLRMTLFIRGQEKTAEKVSVDPVRKVSKEPLLYLRGWDSKQGVVLAGKN
ncbi:MAG: hypothetical protein AAB511_03640 [Patescibacteria group bacterium]